MLNRPFSLLALLCSLAAGEVHAQATVNDFYSPLVEWRRASGFEVTPIHTGLLPNGDVFFLNKYSFFQHPEVDLTQAGFEPEYLFVMQPTPLGSPVPPSVLIQPVQNPAPLRPVLDSFASTLRLKTLACGGHGLLADGRLFLASGSDASIDLRIYQAGNLPASLTIAGIAESVTYDPSTSGWTVNPSMGTRGPATGQPLRWYATVTRLADSRMLVTGGYEKVFPSSSYNRSVEVFDPATNAWSTVSDIHETPPGIENPDYTHVFQFPYAYGEIKTVLMIGGSGEPLFLHFAGAYKSWRRTQNFRPGAKEYIDANPPGSVFPNHTSSSVLLPIRLPWSGWGYANGSVLYAGGEHDTPLAAHVDVYDAGIDAWRPSIPMNGPRHHPSTVVLPDGRILIVAGYDDMSPSNHNGYAEYVDPRNNFAMSRGSAFMPEVRGYHTVTVLLPDGRVLVGSGNVDGNDAIERTNFRYYYPDYMFKTRPQIVSAPATLDIGGSAYIAVPYRQVLGEMALVGLGLMTHSFDMNQRHVQVEASATHSSIRFVSGAWVQAGAAECDGDPASCLDVYYIYAPRTREIAPPGHYMLFILDNNRVPSTGAMVRVQ